MYTCFLAMTSGGWMESCPMKPSLYSIKAANSVKTDWVYPGGPWGYLKESASAGQKPWKTWPKTSNRWVSVSQTNRGDRKSAGYEKSVAIRGAHGGRRRLKKQHTI